MAGQGQKLLGADDPPPVGIDNPGGRSPFLLLGDHAGNAVPASLNSLGLDPASLRSHIAWDIGVRALGAALAARLDAAFVHQAYSRLVVDCNRDPRRPEAILPESDGVRIAANESLDACARSSRIHEIHNPYHAAISWEVARRRAHGSPLALVSLHSFTPVFGGARRPWDIGVLHDQGDTSLAHDLLQRLRQAEDLRVGDNEPYRMDSTDFTIPCFAYPGRIPYVELEVRQDLLDTPARVERWAGLLSGLLGAWPAMPGARPPRMRDAK
jgi:predicted N-formylglutamate amidohydrolase